MMRQRSLFNVLSKDYSNDDGAMIGNLERRHQIPLSLVRRQSGQDHDLNYRRTKDIREESYEDKVYQMTEARKEEELNAEVKENLEKLHREMKWFTIDGYDK